MPTSFTIAKGVPTTILLKPVVAGTSPLEPGAIQASPIPSWDGYDPSVVTVVPAADGLSAVITMLKGNATASIHNSLQNSVNVNIQKTLTVNSPMDPATDIDYSLA